MLFFMISDYSRIRAFSSLSREIFLIAPSLELSIYPFKIYIRLFIRDFLCYAFRISSSASLDPTGEEKGALNMVSNYWKYLYV